MSFLLIGRPNVGKSSIFNILTKTKNIVHSEAYTTRDWHKELIKNTSSYIFDTPGILLDEKTKTVIKDPYFDSIMNNTIETFLYVVDFKKGFNPSDQFSINQLRKYNKEIILIINKCDNPKIPISDEFKNYGINTILNISCSHNLGFKELIIFLIKDNSNIEIKNDNDNSIAIFGKPNAGKSTFLNTLVGYKRSLTSPIAGTTSDFVIEYFNYKKKHIKIIDTAGIGKKANVESQSINFFSIKKSFESIYQVDAGIIIIDSSEGIDRQDKRIIKLVSQKSKSIILIFNKIDLIPNKDKFKSDTILDIDTSLSEIKNIKIFFISSIKKNNVNKIMDYLFEFVFTKDYKISTSKLNQWLKNAVNSTQHPLIDDKRVNFKYAVQLKKKPVTIKVFCSYSDKLRNNYKRYLLNNFNYHFKILNQKTKFIFASSVNPYI